MGALPAPPLVRKLYQLTTFLIFYAICMRNHRTIIGNVAEQVVLDCVPSPPLYFSVMKRSFGSHVCSCIHIPWNVANVVL